MKILNLLEVLDRNSAADWEFDPDSEFPSSLWVDFEIDGVPLMFEALMEKDGIYSIRFCAYDANGNCGHEALNRGFAFARKVLSTVLDIIYTIIKRFKPVGFEFEARGSTSRVAVYDGIAKRLEQYGYHDRGEGAYNKGVDKYYKLYTDEFVNTSK